MKYSDDLLFAAFESHPPASGAALSAALEAIPFALPNDYVNWLRQRNGGEGFVGAEYAVLWSIQDLLVFNAEYGAPQEAPGMFLFGTNGANEGFAFDLENALRIVVIPLIGMARGDALPVADTFSELLRCLYEGRLFPP